MLGEIEGEDRKRDALLDSWTTARQCAMHAKDSNELETGTREQVHGERKDSSRRIAQFADAVGERDPHQGPPPACGSC